MMERRYGEGEERNRKIGGRVKGKEVRGKKAWRRGRFEVGGEEEKKGRERGN